MSATLSSQGEGSALVLRTLTFVSTLGLHVALMAWLTSAGLNLRSNESKPVRLDVRTIVMLPSLALAMPKSVLQSIRPPVRTDKPVAQHQAPILVAAPRADFVPTTFSVPEQSPVLSKAIDSPTSADSSFVTAARFDADYLHNPSPVYPPMSRKLQEEGKVLLHVRVTAAGTAEQVQIKRSSGYARLDEAALNTVLKWRFVPARQGSEVIASTVVVPIVFRLDN